MLVDEASAADPVAVASVELIELLPPPLLDSAVGVAVSPALDASLVKLAASPEDVASADSDDAPTLSLATPDPSDSTLLLDSPPPLLTSPLVADADREASKLAIICETSEAGISPEESKERPWRLWWRWVPCPRLTRGAGVGARRAEERGRRRVVVASERSMVVDVSGVEGYREGVETS